LEYSAAYIRSGDTHIPPLHRQVTYGGWCQK